MPSKLTHFVMDQAVVAPTLLSSFECERDTFFLLEIVIRSHFFKDIIPRSDSSCCPDLV